MDLKDFFPESGHIQRLYCDQCNGHLDLVFDDFSETVSGVKISISGLPVLHCPKCKEKNIYRTALYIYIGQPCIET